MKRKPTTLYKYLSPAGAVRFLKTRLIRFTPPVAFNDPYEMLAAVRSADHDPVCHSTRTMLNGALSRTLSSHIGVLAMSSTLNSELLWSHYAASHTGAAIGFDATHPFFQEGTSAGQRYQFLSAVSYQRSIPEVDVEHFRTHRMGMLNDHGDGWSKLLRSCHPVLFTKSRLWKYEREWRLIRETCSCTESALAAARCDAMFTGARPNQEYLSDPKARPEELATVPPDCISSITLGARSNSYFLEGHSLEDLLYSTAIDDSELRHVRLARVELDVKRFELSAFSLQDPVDLATNVSPFELAARIKGFEAIPVHTKELRAPVSGDA